MQERKEAEAERALMEKRLRDRVAIAEANEAQRQARAAQAEAEKAEDAEFRRRLMEQLAEDDRLEQMNAVRRNQRRAEHHKEVQRLLDDRRAARDRDRRADLDELAEERDRQARRAAIIEQERRRLLEEHAVRLRDFLPKGVLQPQDLQWFPLSHSPSPPPPPT